MTVEQIIKYLMSTEAEQGLVVKEKKSSAKKGPEMVQQENTMAEGKRILLPRRREESSAQAPAQEAAAEPAKGPEMARPQIGAKIGRPPSRPKVEVQAEEAPVQPSAAPSGDLAAELAKFLLPEIQVRVAEVVEAKLAETVNRVVAALTKEINKATSAVADSQAKETERTLNGITALHDLMAVNGLIQWVDQDSGDKSPLDPLLPENKNISIYIQE
jgi:hypothetical protein